MLSLCYSFLLALWNVFHHPDTEKCSGILQFCTFHLKEYACRTVRKLKWCNVTLVQNKTTDILGQNSELLTKVQNLGNTCSVKNPQRGWHSTAVLKVPISYSKFPPPAETCQCPIVIIHSRLHKNRDFIQQATECRWRSQWNWSHYAILIQFTVYSGVCIFCAEKVIRFTLFNCVLRVFLTFQQRLISYQLCILYHLLL